MPGTAEIIHAAEALPVEERALVVESLLRSLNPPDPEIDRKWAGVAKRRLHELRSGRVKDGYPSPARLGWCDRNGYIVR